MKNSWTLDIRKLVRDPHSEHPDQVGWRSVTYGVVPQQIEGHATGGHLAHMQEATDNLFDMTECFHENCPVVNAA